MSSRQVIAAVGSGITTCLLVAVLVIELLAIEFSAIVGVPVGLLAGLFVCVELLARFDKMSVARRRGMSAYAGFGLAVVALLSLRYLNVGRALLSVEVIVGISVLASTAVFVVGWLLGGGE